MKNVVLLGSTGSIGTSTIKVAEDLPDQIRLVGLAAGNNAELLLGASPQASAQGRLAPRPSQGPDAAPRPGSSQRGLLRP